MSSTSQKHRNFVAEPMGRKSVTQLPGVGEVLGSRLQSAGYNEANKVLGQYLVLGKDKERFQQWMENTCQANKKQSSNCYDGLKEWSDSFM